MCAAARGAGYETSLSFYEDEGSWACYCTKVMIASYDNLIREQVRLQQLAESTSIGFDRSEPSPTTRRSASPSESSGKVSSSPLLTCRADQWVQLHFDPLHPARVCPRRANMEIGGGAA